MVGCGLQLRVDGAYHDDARAFFDFLRRVARRHPVAFAFRTVRAGEFHVTLNGSPDAKIDAFLQEIMLSRGLYYYACSIKNRRAVAGKVIAPLFQQLLKSRLSFRSEDRRISARNYVEQGAVLLRLQHKEQTSCRRQGDCPPFPTAPEIAFLSHARSLP